MCDFLFIFLGIYIKIGFDNIHFSDFRERFVVENVY